MASGEINSEFKGFPLAAHGTTVAQFLATKPNLFTADFQFPIMVLRESALAHNIDRMAKYCRGLGVSLAPHVKTPMSPQIAKRQMDAGAWAITVANFAQANVFLDAGFKKIIIGNEVLEPTSIREIAKRNHEGTAEIIFYIDSLAALKIVQSAISQQSGAKLNIFMEIGALGGRAGIRDLGLLKELMVEIVKDPKIKVRGVSGFEGAVPGGDREAGIEKLRAFLRHIVSAAEIVAPYLDEKIIISAGGSSFFDYVAEEFAKYQGDAHIILRSGGYVSHDHIHYEELYPFMGADEADRFVPALELWSRVLSIPEPNLAILNYGKRDAGNDLDNPLPIKKVGSKVEAFSAKIEKLNDQHAFAEITPGSVEVGQIVGCGISHPCTNFDKWRLIPVVDDNYDVVDCIQTHF
ncbi:MAG: alanine racemase [Actinobacteria bacterium]|nr:alanine racemase [Actinomycetota bacterium]